MFITKEELQTAIYEYQLADITGMDVNDIAGRPPYRRHRVT